MKIIEKEIQITDTSALTKNSVFFDIETTGFSRQTARIYLIGTLEIGEDKNIFRQYLTETQADEKILLKKFLADIKTSKALISFNGDSFDLPFIKARCQKYKIDCKVLDQIKSLDLYKEIKEGALFLSLENYKLKTIERYMGIYREDLFSGGDLISLYYEYENGDKNLENILLLHNEEDILNMPNLYSFLAYINETNTIKVSDQSFTIEKISLKKNKLEITGSTSLSLAFLNADNFKLAVENGSFAFECLVKSGNYDESTRCTYLEKQDLYLACNYGIPCPEEIYLLKHGKDQLNLNIKSYFKKILEQIF